MIVRIWHGRTKTTDAEAYRRFVIETGIKDYQSVKGNLGAEIWQRQDGDSTHIYTISWWQSIGSIRAFAGNDFEKAKYYEEDKNYLLEFEPTVMHCDAFAFREKS